MRRNTADAYCPLRPLCPDHGIHGFKRYVALAVLARNIHRLWVVVRERNARAKPRVPEPQKLAA